MTDKETKFEADLKAFFPDIYKIHTHGKWDQYVWKVFDAMTNMTDNNCYGEIKIIYQSGRINQVIKSESVMAGKKNEPNLSYPGKFDKD